MHRTLLGYYPSEVQVRTFRMEEGQKFGKSSHAKHYKRTRNNYPRLLYIARGDDGYKVYEPYSEKVKDIIDDYHRASFEER